MTQDYYGTKRITAWPQKKSDPYSDQMLDGYAVKYADGYTSWSPKETFEEAYQPLNALSFGHALVALEAGHRVARAGWNGKGMWLSLVSAEQWSTDIGPGVHSVPGAHRLPWIGMKTADNGFVPWLASQTDMIAKDWTIAA